MNTKLIEDIQLAIGNRSFAQVSTVTGISKPTLSRMMRQSQKRPLNPALLWKLSRGAQNGITFELLMADAGFAADEVPLYRTRFERSQHEKGIVTDPVRKELILSLLSMIDEEKISFSHEISQISDVTVLLKVKSTTGNRIYVIDGMPEGDIDDQQRHLCEMIGRCFLTKNSNDGKTILVTTAPSRFSSIKSMPSAFADEIILSSDNGKEIIERK